MSAPVAPAQAARQERRTVAFHAELLHEAWWNARFVPPELRHRLDEALLTEPAGNPFLPLAHAHAVQHGATFDEALLTRRLLHVNALPEIVDPETMEQDDARTPHRLHVTLHTPLRVAETRPMQARVSVYAADGRLLWSRKLPPARAAAYAAFEVRTAVPVQWFPDGRYEVRAELDLGDEAPRAFDPRAGATVWVQRGFAARARALEDAAAGLLAQEQPVALQCALLGALAPVRRVYGGDARDGVADPRADLAHAERVIDDVRAGRPPLARAEGFVSVALVLQPGPLPHQPTRELRARLRPAAEPARSGGELPGLVLFVAASPTWDGAWSYPTAVRAMPAGFLARVLGEAGFDAEGEFACAVVESLAEVSEPMPALARLVQAFAELTPIDLGRVVLVGERDGAGSVLSFARQAFWRRVPCGVVCVAGGALAPGEIGMLADTELMPVLARGHRSEENLRCIVDYATQAGRGERVHLVASARAWPWALWCALPEIAAFCRARLR